MRNTEHKLECVTWKKKTRKKSVECLVWKKSMGDQQGRSREGWWGGRNPATELTANQKAMEDDWKKRKGENILLKKEKKNLKTLFRLGSR